MQQKWVSASPNQLRIYFTWREMCPPLFSAIVTYNYVSEYLFPWGFSRGTSRLLRRFIPYSDGSCFSLAIGELDSPFSRRVGVPTRFLSNGRFQRFGRCVLFILISVYKLYPVVETGFQSFPAFVAGFSLGEGTLFRPFLCASLSWLAFLKALYCKLVICDNLNLGNSFALLLQRLVQTFVGFLPFCERFSRWTSTISPLGAGLLFLRLFHCNVRRRFLQRSKLQRLNQNRLLTARVSVQEKVSIRKAWCATATVGVWATEFCTPETVWYERKKSFLARMGAP